MVNLYRTVGDVTGAYLPKIFMQNIRIIRAKNA